MARAAAKHEAVILVAGLWAPWFCMLPLASKLKRCGYRVSIVKNNTRGKTPRQNAIVVLDAILEAKLPVVHLVGHSLGGIVLMHVLEEASQASIRLPAGRVILLGSPVKGSKLARHLHRRQLWRFLFGQSCVNGILGEVPSPDTSRKIGIVAGIRSFGLSSLIYRHTGDNDGVVAVSETHLDGVQDVVQIPQSHTLMLFSSECAARVDQFLSQGAFADNDAKN